MNLASFNLLENKTHPKVRLNSICPYFTMFPLKFPYRVLKTAKKTDLIFDPFCGRGTTNYAARLLGLQSFGIDSNPVACAIAKSKLIKVDPEKIFALCMDILLHTEPKNVPSGEFWKWAYHEDTLIDICRIREYFMTKETPNDVEIGLRAIVLGLLHGPLMKTQASYLSNQMPRTFATKPEYSVNYWKRHSLIPQYVNLLDLVWKKANYIFNEDLPSNHGGRIILGDSRNFAKITNKKIDWIITSPPYYGMSTYEQDQWLRNWFLGGAEKVQYANNTQIKHYSEKVFIEDLAKVWRNGTKLCNPKAKLIIRFGALPSKLNSSPTEIIKKSLVTSDVGWEIKTIKKAGSPGESNRQASQFGTSTGNYVEEIDVYAHLNA